jgi:hypothetical protein
MDIQDEIEKLPRGLKYLAYSLTDFASSFDPNGHFSFETNQWVFRPKNFITFQFHYRRAKNITICLRGKYEEFLNRDKILVLDKARGGYSRCSVFKTAQLSAAAYYIERAFELYQKGRTRTPRKPILEEGKI